MQIKDFRQMIDATLRVIANKWLGVRMIFSTGPATDAL